MQLSLWKTICIKCQILFSRENKKKNWSSAEYAYSVVHVNRYVIYSPGPCCSKLTMSLVNDSLKLTLSDTQIC